ncbi:putative trichohyalin [Besnoitia besnoiti]|uniref:Putative trichohyalin n=1 Tax=Besnoitia besnoiti TaxID=94643 RepID=A0A2A9MJL5_BESBE|nr:putative trichohyalin [Besnoitia besnoiti]PFH36441.1 putative trichohyalin [Besnoitia besnoiti]
MKKLLSLQLGSHAHGAFTGMPHPQRSPREPGEGDEDTVSVAGRVSGDMEPVTLSRRSSAVSSSIATTPRGTRQHQGGGEKQCKCCKKGCTLVGRLRQQLQNLREEKTQLENLISMQTMTLHQIDRDGRQMEKISSERLESQRKLAALLQDEQRSTEERLKAAAEAVTALQTELNQVQQHADSGLQSLREQLHQQTAEAAHAAGRASQLEADLEAARKSLEDQRAVETQTSRESDLAREKAKALELELEKILDQKNALEKLLEAEQQAADEEREGWRRKQEELEREFKYVLEGERETWKKLKEEREKEHQELLAKALADVRAKDEERERRREEDEEDRRRKRDAEDAERRKRLEEEDETRRKKRDAEDEERRKKREQDEEERARERQAARSKIQELERQLEEGEARTQQLQTKLKEMEETQQSLKRQSSEEKHALVSEVEVLMAQAAQTADYRDVTEQLKKAERENEDLELRIEALVSEKEAAIREAAAAVEKAQAEVTRLETEIRRKDNEIVMFTQSAGTSEEEEEERDEGPAARILRRNLRKIEKLEAELRTKEAAVHDLETKVDHVLASQSNAVMNLAAKEAELARAQKTNEDLQRRVEEDKKRRDERQKELISLEDEHKALLERNAELVRELAKGGQKVAALEANLRTAEQSLQGVKEEMSAKLSETVAQDEQEIKRLSKELAEAQKHLQEGTAEDARAVEELQGLLEQSGKLTMDLAEKEEEVGQLRQQIHVLEEKLKQRDEAAASKAKLCRDLAARDAELAAMRQKLSDAEEELRLRARSRAGSEWKVTALVQTNTELVAKLAKAEEELAAERRAASQAKDETKKLSSQQRDQEEQIHALVRANTQLVSDLADKDAKLSEANRTLTAQGTRLEILQPLEEKSSQQEALISHLEASKDTLSDQVTRLDAELAAMRKEAEDANSAAKDREEKTKREMEALNKQKAEMEGRLDARSAELARANGELTKLSEELHLLKLSGPAREQEMTELIEAKATLMDELGKKERDISEAHKAAREKEAQLRSSLAAAHAEIEAKTKQIAELSQFGREDAITKRERKEKIAASHAELATLKARLAETEKALKLAKEGEDGEVQKLVATNSALVSELAEKDAELSALKLRLANAEKQSQAEAAQAPRREEMQRLLVVNSELTTRVAAQEAELAERLQALEASKSENETLRKQREAASAANRDRGSDRETRRALDAQKAKHETAMREQLEHARVLLAAEKEKRVMQNVKLRKQLSAAQEARSQLEHERDEAIAAAAACASALEQRRQAPPHSPSASSATQCPANGAAAAESEEAAAAGESRLEQFSREIQALREDGAGISPAEEAWMLNKAKSSPAEVTELLRVHREELRIREQARGFAGAPSLAARESRRRGLPASGELEDTRNHVELTAAEAGFFGDDGLSVLAVLGAGERPPQQVPLASPLRVSPPPPSLSAARRPSPPRLSPPSPPRGPPRPPALLSPLSLLEPKAPDSPVSRAADVLTSVAFYHPSMLPRGEGSPLHVEEKFLENLHVYRYAPAASGAIPRAPALPQSPEEILKNPFPLILALAEPSHASAETNARRDAPPSPSRLPPFFAPLPLSRPFLAARGAKLPEARKSGASIRLLSAAERNAEGKTGEDRRRRTRIPSPAAARK